MRKGRLTMKRKKEIIRGIYLKPLILIYLSFIVIAQTAGGTTALFNDVEVIKNSLHAKWDVDDDSEEGWDKSSLEFIGEGYDSQSDAIFATVKNGGDGDMAGPSEYEILYIVNSNNTDLKAFKEAFGEENVVPIQKGNGQANGNNNGNGSGDGTGGNPRYQIIVYEGSIPKMKSGDSEKLVVELEKLPKLSLLLGNEKGEFKFKGYHRPGHHFDNENRFVIMSDDIKVSDILKDRDVNPTIIQSNKDEDPKIENETESDNEKETKVKGDNIDQKETVKEEEKESEKDDSKEKDNIKATKEEEPKEAIEEDAKQKETKAETASTKDDEIDESTSNDTKNSD